MADVTKPVADAGAEKAYAEAAAKVEPATPIATPVVAATPAESIAPAVKPTPVAKPIVAPVAVKAAPAVATPAPAPVKVASAKVTPVKSASVKAAPKSTPAKTASVKAAPPVKAPPVKAIPVKAAAVKTVAAKPTKTVPASKPAAPKPALTKETKTMATTTTEITTKIQDAVKDAAAKAKTFAEKGQAGLGEASEFAKGNVEAMVASTKILASGMQEMGKGYAAEAKTAFETMTADAKDLASAKSPTEFFEKQTAILKKNFDAAVAKSSKSSEAMLKLANEAFQPLSTRMSLAMEKVKKAA